MKSVGGQVERLQLALGLCSLLAIACSRADAGNAPGQLTQRLTPGARIAELREIVLAPAEASSVQPLDGEGVTAPAFAPRSPTALPPPLCEDPASETLLRTGCPEPAQLGEECEVEGLECRYAGASPPPDPEAMPNPNQGACAQVVECALGVWTRGDVECESFGSNGTVLSGSPACDVHPIPDSPCEENGSSCGWKCPLGSAYTSVATCTCGRWQITHGQCAID